MLASGEPLTIPIGQRVKRRCGLGAMATMFALAHCVESATIVITAERQGEAIDIHASAQLQSDAETAWRVLTAYDRYTDFIPDLRASRIVARQGPTTTVEQTGDARVWGLPVPLEITFEIVEFPPTNLRSRAIAGTLRALENSYTLKPGEQGVGLDYVGRITPGFGFFGPIELQAVRQNVARQFQALADEIERQSADARTH